MSNALLTILSTEYVGKSRPVLATVPAACAIFAHENYSLSDQMLSWLAVAFFTILSTEYVKNPAGQRAKKCC
jgi:hypothetical protein